MNTKRDIKSFDFLLVLLVLALAALGVILVGSATTINNEGASLKLFQFHIVWVALGIIAMFVMAFIDFKFICKFYIPIYIVNILLLLIVLIIGPLDGSTTARSIPIPGGTIQPSEFNKIFMIIFLAKYIDKHKEKINNLLILGSVFLLTIIPVYLIQREPSLSASLVTVVIMGIMLFVSKLNYRYILIVLAVATSLVVVIAHDVNLVSGFERIQASNDDGALIVDKNGESVTNLITIYVEDSSIILIDKVFDAYQIKRLKAFADPENYNDKDASYQNDQALNAIGSGQLSGKGLFKGEVYVPYASNDFIFTTLAEEFGFVGCIITLALIFMIVFRCIVIANRSDIFYGKLIASAVGGMFAFQTFGNVGVNTGILPNTGMIFPFISSGGSALLVFMALVGMVLNIGMTKPKSMFED